MTICKTPLPKWFKDEHFRGGVSADWLLPCYAVFQRGRRERHERCPQCGIRILSRKSLKAVKEAWMLAG